MAVELEEYVDSLRREVLPLDAEDPGPRDEVLVGYLVDAFWDARLDGFMKGYIADSDGIVIPVSGTKDLPREQIALIVIYAGIRILRLQVLNTDAYFRAKAGAVEFETRTSASALAEMLKQLERRKEALLEALTQSDVTVLDALTVRTLSPGAYGGWVGYFGDPVMP